MISALNVALSKMDVQRDSWAVGPGVGGGGTQHPHLISHLVWHIVLGNFGVHVRSNVGWHLTAMMPNWLEQIIWPFQIT